jgi:hypothetical protein
MQMQSRAIMTQQPRQQQLHQQLERPTLRWQHLCSCAGEVLLLLLVLQELAEQQHTGEPAHSSSNSSSSSSQQRGSFRQSMVHGTLQQQASTAA